MQSHVGDVRVCLQNQSLVPLQIQHTRAWTGIGLAQHEIEGYEGRRQHNNLINDNKRSHLQVSDGLFSYQLLFLVPLHGAHYTGPQHADHGLFRDGVFLHLLFAVHNDLQKSTRRNR